MLSIGTAQLKSIKNSENYNNSRGMERELSQRAKVVVPAEDKDKYKESDLVQKNFI